MKFTINLGEYAEGYSWNLVSDYEDQDYGYNGNRQCAHIEWLGDSIDRLRPDGSIFGTERKFRLPLVAICRNEGGHNCTILCVLCLDEARKAHGL